MNPQFKGPALATPDLSSVRITYHHVQELYECVMKPAQLWRFDVEAPVGTGSEWVQLGMGEVLLLDIYGGDPLSSLMAHGPAALGIGEVIFDRQTGELDQALADSLEMIGGQLLVINRLDMDSRYRRIGLPALVGGLVIKRLAGWSVAVVYAPHQETNGCENGRWELATQWAALGFRPFRDGVHVLDPALPAFQAAFDRAVQNVLNTLSPH
jgi:hypothetical protein